MTQEGHLSGAEILIAVISVWNVCLLVALSFYRERGSAEGIDRRVKAGFVAMFLGLTSQLFFLLMGPWILRWLVLDRASLLLRFPTVGFLLSMGAFFTAWFGRGIRRYASLWVAVTTGYFWILAGFVFLFSPL